MHYILTKHLFQIMLNYFVYVSLLYLLVSRNV